ncbi:MAG: protein kinase [Planctomycetes bacterium]|nr:protein kinase [Planctomycetota bacterium]MCB9889594.1 protein kinase [Planctomycetota bacterium]
MEHRQLGDFILLDEIGRGGMGTVYRARQISMERMVALKVLPSFGSFDPEAVARFRREAEAAGRLSHPGIVPIYSVGNADGTHFYAMELVEGPSLQQLIDSLRNTPPGQLKRGIMDETAMAQVFPHLRQQPPLPAFLDGALYPASCAALIMEVAGALTAAHLGRVIHRDLKPSNILMHPAGRTVLVDFGLARDELSYRMTQTGDAVGTPSYMAPEQASGGAIDARADIYGLGATLYEMLTLRPPFDGKGSAEIMAAILREDPVAPRKLNPRVPRALETIVLTCLAKDPDQRYSTAAELQSDLRAFLAGGAIRARRPGVVQLIGRRVRRNRRTAYVALVAAMFATLVGLMIALVSINNRRQAGRLALDNAKFHLLEGRPREAHAAYVQALVLLADERLVANRRLAAFREVFPVLYEKHRYPVLTAFLDGLPVGDVDRPEYHDFRRRVAGIGSLRIEPVEGGVAGTTWVRGLDHSFETGWRRLPLDGQLSIGRYLIRTEVEGMAPVVRMVEVQRDSVRDVTPQLSPVSHLPSGMALVARGDVESVFAVDRTEVTVEQYARFLQSIDDPELRAELEPLHWGAQQRVYLPVCGLSFRQARLAAALMGRHLMSREEYRWAATCGVPSFRYPWGKRFDVRRVVGDPRYTRELAPAEGTRNGASPGGILHLVGNVGEPLSVGGCRGAGMAGGSWASMPRDLTVDSVVELERADEQHAELGLRRAYFVSPPDDPTAEAWLRDECAKLSSLSEVAAAARWTLRADGKLRVREERWLATDQTEVLVTVPDGFRPLAEVSAAGDDHEALVSREGPRGRTFTTRRATARQRVRIDQYLEPIEGLHAAGDGYVLRLPLSAAHQTIHRLELPAGSSIEEVWPAPERIYRHEGVPVLVWRCAATKSTDVGSVYLRFRRDGLLAQAPPPFAAVRTFVQQLFQAVQSRDAGKLGGMLADDCRWLAPQRRSREEMLRALDRVEVLDRVVVHDVVAVGSVWTVELTAREVSSGEQRAFRLLLRHTGNAMLALRLVAATCQDLGEVTEGRYRHPGLRLRLEPPKGATIRRLAAAETELQFEVSPESGASDCGVLVLGTVRRQDLSETVLRRRLLAVGPDATGGELLSGGKVESIGGGEGHSERWLIPEQGGTVVENRTLVTRGNRHVMVRAFVRAADPDAARHAYRRHEGWFRAVLQGLRIE